MGASGYKGRSGNIIGQGDDDGIGADVLEVRYVQS